MHHETVASDEWNRMNYPSAPGNDVTSINGLEQPLVPLQVPRFSLFPSSHAQTRHTSEAAPIAFRNVPPHRIIREPIGLSTTSGNAELSSQQYTRPRNELEDEENTLPESHPPPSYVLREQVHPAFICSKNHLEQFKKYNLTLQGNTVNGRIKDKFKLVAEAVRENDMGLTGFLLQDTSLLSMRIKIDGYIRRASIQDKTLLHLSSDKGFFELTKLLINKGAPLEAVDAENHTPLHLAINNGQEAVVRLLLANGANVNATDAYHNSPLFLAVRQSNAPVTLLLLASGAEVNKGNQSGNTPLHLATINHNETIAEILLSSGANINATNGLGDTSLHVAARHGNRHLVRLFLEVGAVRSSRNMAHRTPKDLARRAGHDTIVAILKSNSHVDSIVDSPMYYR